MILILIAISKTACVGFVLISTFTAVLAVVYTGSQNNDGVRVTRLSGGSKKDVYSSSWNLRATERHLPYGITQCYLPPDTGERAPPEPQPCRPVLDLHTPERWKAELTCYSETQPGVELATSLSRIQRPNH